MKVQIKHVIFIALLVCSKLSMGQDSSLKIFNKIDLGFSGLGFSSEMPLSCNILIEGAAGLGAGYEISENDFSYHWYFNDPSVYLSLHGKYYFNRAKREKKGQSLRFNAGNFIGIKAKYTTRTLRYDSNPEALLVGVHWGLQRQLSSHFAYQFQLGLGKAFDTGAYSNQSVFFLDSNIRFSYILPF